MIDLSPSFTSHSIIATGHRQLTRVFYSVEAKNVGRFTAGTVVMMP